MHPGTCVADAPITVDGKSGWLLNQLGAGFALLVFGLEPEPVKAGVLTPTTVVVGQHIDDIDGLAAECFDAKDGAVYLIRPDQHVAARWRSFDLVKIKAAILQATGGKTQ